MDVDARRRADVEVKDEDDSGDTRMADDKPTYRSWKKKYRKMRIVFDQKMHEGEELHRLEQKALATAHRLAVQKDRLLDLLLDVNNSAQIPPEKRFDLSLDPPSDPETLCLDIDHPATPPSSEARGLRSYRQLLRDVPHSKFASAAERFPDLLADLEAGADSPANFSPGQTHPPSFLSADDIDNYIWEIDTRLANKQYASTAVMPPLLPTLAPAAHSNDAGGAINGAANGTKDPGLAPLTSNTRDFALRNPTSVYNWLRKNAPKTFLQDAETHPNADKENGDEPHAPSARRAKGERSGGRGGTGPTRNKRGSAVHHGGTGRDKSVAVVESLEDDDTAYEAAATPGASGTANILGGKGKRKRVVDEDLGYRPKGGSSRPTKKKRKSDGDSTPTATGSKRARKSTGGDD
ncbi:IEC3 subunit of the Ino80 complex, chromatin re-modelling-domain-containing protein [Podospora didyma]|uniref:IEC3 subunit of the Ino80 complex, chromatin re-modelling-domain-containing protein n=1 Tax=Podospora didyma TaxID=330526 RepID=A0AAE0P7X5_9PEZI|nr:IEC3 subunit of the Ino80 complex, chromatin re-modelling-domain-containing protein [Podospora didyma]